MANRKDKRNTVICIKGHNKLTIQSNTSNTFTEINLIAPGFPKPNVRDNTWQVIRHSAALYEFPLASLSFTGDFAENTVTFGNIISVDATAVTGNVLPFTLPTSDSVDASNLWILTSGGIPDQYGFTGGQGLDNQVLPTFGTGGGVKCSPITTPGIVFGAPVLVQANGTISANTVVGVTEDGVLTTDSTAFVGSFGQTIAYIFDSMGFETSTSDQTWWMVLISTGVTIPSGISPSNIALTSGQMIIGNTSNVGAGAAVTGDITAALTSGNIVTALGNDVVDTANIADSAITGDLIEDETITMSKMIAGAQSATIVATYGVDVATTGVNSQIVLNDGILIGDQVFAWFYDDTGTFTTLVDGSIGLTSVMANGQFTILYSVQAASSYPIYYQVYRLPTASRFSKTSAAKDAVLDASKDIKNESGDAFKSKPKKLKEI